LILENISKNLADNDEYPAMLHLHQRCVSMLGNLWRTPTGEQAIGTATTGSSEAILLGGLAMKRKWKERQEAKGCSQLTILMVRKGHFEA
jgi:glutamate decarboxylase